MRRLVATLALAILFVFDTVSSAFAHETANGTPAADNAFGSEPALNGIGHANPKGVSGIVRGFVVHAPTCAVHCDGGNG